MNQLGRISLKAVAVGLAAFIVIGGFALALLGMQENITTPGIGFSPGTVYSTSTYPNLSGLQASINSVAGTTTILPPPSVVVGPKGTPSSTTASHPPSQSAFDQSSGGRFIEFFSNMTMESPTPSMLASKVVGLAYSVGGYVAYQSTLRNSAYVVVRVPASSYQQVLSQIQTLGNVTSLISTSNDVTVKYTDLNATLASLLTEQQALLRLVNQSTSVNNTLAIMTQLQNVNAQINSVKSAILQTQRLISYSTITASISKSAEARPLSMTLSATPKSGVVPLGVTFRAVVNGGQQPYLVNYNFGDGTSQQGQVVVHQFYQEGDFNVTVSATDYKGNVTTTFTLIHVSAAPTKVGFGDFGTTLANLFIRVVEGMAEIAVIIALPAVLVVGLIVAPLRRRGRAQKEPRQS